MPYANAVYYPNYRVYENKTPASTIEPQFVSHIFYSFAYVRSDGEIVLNDVEADNQRHVDGVNGAIRACVALKQKNHALKVILSIGGGGFCGQHPEIFPSVASTESTRQKFVSSAINLLNKYSLDGIDVDWEGISKHEDGTNFVALLECLRSHLPHHNYIITTALQAGEWTLQYIDLARLAQSATVNLMAYDFYGPWSHFSGYHSQLLPSATGDICIHTAVQYLLKQGVSPGQILLGIPLYGRAFPGCTSVGQTCHDMQEHVFNYEDLPRPGTRELVDHDAVAACCIDRVEGLVTYDNGNTVMMKANYVKEQKLGGLFYWEVTQDKPNSDSLVRTGYLRLMS